MKKLQTKEPNGKKINKKNMKTDKIFDINFKMKLYAQYYRQEIVRFNNGKTDTLLMISPYMFNDRSLLEITKLELKSTDDITNEDKQVLEQSIIGFVESVFEVGYFMYLKCNSSISEDAITIQLNTYHIDYLRSQGYALPFMEYSVDDLIALDYISLIQK